MARMLPRAPSEKTVSRAERLMFRRFADQCPDEWTVLHSLGLKTHNRKPWAEADFVLVASAGVLVVEVKGGHVTRKDRQWFTNDQDLRESPFEQAASAAAALTNDLHQAVPSSRRAIVGSAVAFPDVEFHAEGPDIIPEIVLDARTLAGRLDDWISSVFAYWRQRIAAKGQNERPGLSQDAAAAIVERLAGDLDLRPSLRSSLAEVESEMIRLTAEQQRVLAGLDANPRVLVDGGAGTGKTLLALEEVLECSRAGRSVLMVCHSKALARHLREAVGDAPGVHIEHFHGMTTRLIREADLESELPDAAPADLFGTFHPELALDALSMRDDPWIFDALVVDEAQDLLSEPALELLDSLVRGGLRDGRWRMFRDPLQDVLRHTEAGALERFAEGRAATFRLNTNCRNTAEIATQTAIVSDRALTDLLPISGPAVEYLWFADERDQTKQAARLLRKWIDGGVSPGEIVVLSLYRRENSALRDGLPAGVPAQLVDLAELHSQNKIDNRIRFATVAGFKGLEADAVLLLDAGDLAEPRRAVDLYVGLSRATKLLAVGMRESQREQLDEHVAAFGRRLVSPD